MSAPLLALIFFSSVCLTRAAHRADSARRFDEARARFEPFLKPTEARA